MLDIVVIYDIIKTDKGRYNIMKKVYIDMDGVLADFEGQTNALERYTHEAGFFAKLRQLPFVKELRRYIEIGALPIENVYILSASPNVQADLDKRFWINLHVPEIIDENIMFVRNGKEKAKFAKGGNILIDDYSENLIYWEKQGGQGVKVHQPHSKGIKWKGQRILTNG